MPRSAGHTHPPTFSVTCNSTFGAVQNEQYAHDRKRVYPFAHSSGFVAGEPQLLREKCHSQVSPRRATGIVALVVLVDVHWESARQKAGTRRRAVLIHLPSPAAQPHGPGSAERGSDEHVKGSVVAGRAHSGARAARRPAPAHSVLESWPPG